MHKYKLVWLLFSFSSLYYCNAQTEWSLKKDKDGIQVFTGKLPDSKFNAIKVNCTIEGTLSSLAAIVLQPELQPEWVLATKTAKLEKQLAPNHLYYYAIASLPWPMTNRDMVIDLIIHQDSLSKKMTIHANTIDKVMPEISSLQRVPFSNATWEIIPMGENKIQIEYILKINPGGGIPPWMVNMFIARAPFETFKNLSRIILDKRFQVQKFDFIRN